MRYRKGYILMLLCLSCLGVVSGQQSGGPFSGYTSSGTNNNQEVVMNTDAARGELKIYAEEGGLTVESATMGEVITIYNAVGRVLKQITLRRGTNKILISGGRQLLIVKVGNTAYKIQIK